MQPSSTEAPQASSASHVYSSAKELLEDLRGGKLSSRELLEQYIARIERRDGALNAVVARDFAGARKAADAADLARGRGEGLGPLHGLPLTLKDTWEVPGMPCAAGAPEYREHRPTEPADVVRRLQEAGAIVFGKTNVPYLASDIQTYNEVYGTTNNPWGTERTPGGSSGGAAAALAAGFTPLEVGSDLAGSIRIPAHYCGVYGHKPTYGVVSFRGHVPGPPGTLSEPTLAVAGPMSRSAADLRLLLDVLLGPPRERSAWSLKLPEPPQRLEDYRVLLWTDDPLCPVDDELREQYQRLGQKLGEAGVKVTVGPPRGFRLEQFYALYLRGLGALLGAALPARQRHLMGLTGALMPVLSRALGAPADFGHFLRGINQRSAHSRLQQERTARLGADFHAVFEDFDVILMPPALTTAIPHDKRPSLMQRKIRVNGQQRAYSDLFVWIALASLLGLPATSAPLGATSSGLPFNVQIVGAAYRDYTTIRFAELLAPLMGGFARPPGF
ncbi:MAG: amidase [Myxococcales bacterium]|nr:amidase [Myxococcales bacterium]